METHEPSEPDEHPFQRLNAIVKGRRGVSADTALLLEELTGWDAQIWLTLQTSGTSGMP